MVVNSKIIISLLGVTLLFQACNSPDKNAVKGDSVVDVGGGMDVKRDTGFNFDKHYIAMMVDEHSKTIALFNSGADTKEKEVRKFALKMLPVLDRHYFRAKSIMATFK